MIAARSDWLQHNRFLLPLPRPCRKRRFLSEEARIEEIPVSKIVQEANFQVSTTLAIEFCSDHSTYHHTSDIRMIKTGKLTGETTTTTADEVDFPCVGDVLRWKREFRLKK